MHERCRVELLNPVVWLLALVFALALVGVQRMLRHETRSSHEQAS